MGAKEEDQGRKSKVGTATARAKTCALLHTEAKQRCYASVPAIWFCCAPELFETACPLHLWLLRSCRTLRPSNKTLIWDNAETLLFKGVMDSELAYYLERQMAPVSESLDAKVAQVSVRIAKQTGGRNMSSFGGAPVRTMLHGYKFSRRIYLQPMVGCCGL